MKFKIQSTCTAYYECIIEAENEDEAAEKFYAGTYTPNWGEPKNLTDETLDKIETLPENTCVSCGELYPPDFGNNGLPYADGRVCDDCNAKFVIPARLEAIS